jgi:hypothetical protein
MLHNFALKTPCFRGFLLLILRLLLCIPTKLSQILKKFSLRGNISPSPGIYLTVEGNKKTPFTPV